MPSGTAKPRPGLVDSTYVPPVMCGVVCGVRVVRARALPLDPADGTLPKKTSTEPFLSCDISIHSQEAQK